MHCRNGCSITILCPFFNPTTPRYMVPPLHVIAYEISSTRKKGVLCRGISLPAAQVATLGASTWQHLLCLLVNTRPLKQIAIDLRHNHNCLQCASKPPTSASAVLHQPLSLPLSAGMLFAASVRNITTDACSHTAPATFPIFKYDFLNSGGSHFILPCLGFMSSFYGRFMGLWVHGLGAQYGLCAAKPMGRTVAGKHRLGTSGDSRVTPNTRTFADPLPSSIGTFLRDASVCRACHVSCNLNSKYPLDSPYNTSLFYSYITPRKEFRR